jgi:hypothetical protein
MLKIKNPGGWLVLSQAAKPVSQPSLPVKKSRRPLASGVAPDSGVDDLSGLPHSLIYANTNSYNSPASPARGLATLRTRIELLNYN